MDSRTLNAGLRRPANRRRGQRGFTLLEVLVVVTLVAIMGAAVTLSLSTRGDHRLTSHAERLLGAMNYASEAAVISGRAFGFFVTPRGYEMVQFDGSDWQTASTGSISATQVLAAPYRLRGKSVYDLPTREAPSPQMVFLPDGAQYYDGLALFNETSGESWAVEAAGAGRFGLVTQAAE